jgi:PIN domain nuclease of toxin-antitoxin system
LKYLLDTGVWLWSLHEPERLSRAARKILEDPVQEIFLSSVTAWEIGIKSASGKLRLPEPATSYVPRRMAEQGLRPLQISHQHALEVFRLPIHHRDPFDRLLIVQARLERLTLIAADHDMQKYDVPLLWAGQ